MGGFRFRTIAPGSSGGSGQGGNLPPDALEALREDAWNEGYLAGQAAATESHLAEQGRLTSDFVEALNDAAMTNEAARHHAAVSLAPVLEALTSAVAPALAEAGLAAEISRLVSRAIEAAPECRPCLRCAPEMEERIAGILSDRGLVADIESAPELLPREARIFWEQGYDHLDLDDCIDRMRVCIAAHLKSETGSEAND